MSNAERSNHSLAWLKWPVVVVGLLGLHVTLMLAGLVAAFSMPAAVVDSRAYENGLEWDQQRAEAAASAALGWSLTLTPGESLDVYRNRSAVFELRDADGGLVAGAELEVTLFHHARPNESIGETLQESAPGVFEAEMPLRREGLWRLEAVATRGAERFVVRQDLWIGPAESFAKPARRLP